MPSTSSIARAWALKSEETRTLLILLSAQADQQAPLLSMCPTRTKRNLGARQVKITSGKKVVHVIVTFSYEEEDPESK